MVKPIKMGRVRPTKSLNFEKIIGYGQNPRGFTAETPNGTAHCGNNPGFNQNTKSPSWPAMAVGPWKNANRTGE